MGIINRYKLKEGWTLERIADYIVARRKDKRYPFAMFGKGGSWINDRTQHFISCKCGDEDISLNIGFPEDLSSWDDYEDILIMDEEAGQPYYPFYDADDKPDKRFHFVLNIIGNYNRIMDSFEFLERTDK